MKNNWTRTLFAYSLFCLGASGCAGFNGELACPYKGGVACRRLSEVSQQFSVERVEKKRILPIVTSKHKKQPLLTLKKFIHQKPVVKENTPVTRKPPGSYQEAQQASTKGGPQRAREQVMAIWVAPFTDVAGDYHSAHTVYHVMQSARWIIP